MNQDLTGLTLGNWEVLARAGVRHYGRRRAPMPLWRCRCVNRLADGRPCGHERLVAQQDLRREPPSRFCFQCRAGRAEPMRSDPAYSNYQSMLAHHYRVPKRQGRPVAVAPEWLGTGGYDRFRADVGPRPSPEHVLCRRDTRAPFSKANCHWRRRRPSLRLPDIDYAAITHDGRTQNVRAWSDETGLTARLIRERLRRGWPVARALTQPSDRTSSWRHRRPRAAPPPPVAPPVPAVAPPAPDDGRLPPDAGAAPLATLHRPPPVPLQGALAAALRRMPGHGAQPASSQS